MRPSSDAYRATAQTKDRVRNPVPERADVVIVGCGVGGLMAAASLARAGKHVVALDQHYVAGGCGTQFERGRGGERYHFDVGLHYLGDCEPGGMIPAMLDKVGAAVTFEPMDPDGFDTFVFPDFAFRMPVGIDRFRDRLVEHFPGEVKGIDRYCRLLREIDHITGDVEKNRGKVGIRAALKVLTGGRLLARYQNATIGTFLDSCTDNPRLRAVLLGQSGDYGLPPSEVSAMLHCGLSLHYLKGAWYPHGGGQVIADRLAEVVESNGGSIHLRRAVERILVEGGRTTGVQLQGKRGEPGAIIRAPIVVSNADYKRTMLELLDSDVVPEAQRSWARDAQMGGALFMTCLGVRGDMRDRGMRKSNYWCFDSYDMEALYARARRGDYGDHEVAYITSASLKDPTNPLHHAPEGIQNVEVLTMVSGDPAHWGTTEEEIRSGRYRRSDAYNAKKAEVEERMLNLLEKHFPGTRDEIVFCESTTPPTQSRFTWSSEGSGYGLACTPEQFLNNRPGYRGPVPGLYLCGHSTRAGHGIVGAMRSGDHAAGCVLRDAARAAA